jgi:hypothetical protein
MVSLTSTHHSEARKRREITIDLAIGIGEPDNFGLSMATQALLVSKITW